MLSGVKYRISDGTGLAKTKKKKEIADKITDFILKD